LKYIHEANVVT